MFLENAMQGKFFRYFTVSFLTVLAAIGVFSAGLLVGWAIPENPTAALNLPLLGRTDNDPQVQTTTGPDTETLFEPFWQTWDLIHEQYVDQPVDEEKLMRGAISGMIASLDDPHSSYMDPEQFDQANAPLTGEYEGIGAWVDLTGEFLKIVSPMPNSPAERAGLESEDIVIAVNGEDMTGVDGNLVLREIIGPAGTEVTLTIQREGAPEPFDVTIERDYIRLASAEGRMLEENIAYVQLNTFGDQTISELRAALKELMAEEPDGLILDLRNNGGGYLNTAIDVLSEFLPGNQVVMYEVFADDTTREFKTKRGGLATEIPLVVLVNEGSASASEITAGAIQDLDRGVLVGTLTYGKGSVQNWSALENDQGAVRITVARWLTPDERQINEIGLQPDYEVELTEEDFAAERDPQLDKALEVLQEMIAVPQ
jgi:carboxyl-terminal processing protease